MGNWYWGAGVLERFCGRWGAGDAFQELVFYIKCGVALGSSCLETGVGEFPRAGDGEQVARALS